MSHSRSRPANAVGDPRAQRMREDDPAAAHRGPEVPDSGEIWLNGMPVPVAGRTLVPPHRRQTRVRLPGFGPVAAPDGRENLHFVLGSLNLPRERHEPAEHVMPWRWFASSSSPHAILTSSPAASSSGSRLPVRSLATRASCCWTSRFRAWIRSFAQSCARSSPVCSGPRADDALRHARPGRRRRSCRPRGRDARRPNRRCSMMTENRRQERA